ncbi:MAG TPA: hypothetical protein PLO89_09810, partial [Spirochaetota bacterium]|nr:hypothetical protein [Spirochaetota bacterium]
MINSIITENFIYYVENTMIYIILYFLTLLFLSFLFYYFNIDKIIIGYAILLVFITTLSFGIFILFNVYLNILISLFPLTFIFIAFLVNKYFNEKLNNFLFYIVTHDIKNELYNIALNSKIIKNLSTQEPLLPHIETIMDSSEKLFDFTEKTIRLFKLKRNKLVLNYEKINLNETIKDILR